MTSPSISIIIPAHNEAQVIHKTLDALGRLGAGNDFEIIVVCNGCVDDTETIVKQFDIVTLIRTDIPSKTNALNLGDRRARGKTRIYMDADVLISADHIQLLVNELHKNDYLAATPNIKMDVELSSWMVRAYYDIWLQLPYVKEGFMGSGIYAISETGRQRFDRFPDLISDDGFVRGQFTREEITRIDNAFSTVKSPLSLSGLIKIKTRSRLGHFQLLARYPNLNLGDRRETYFEVARVLIRPGNLLKSIVYVGVNLICRMKARKIIASGIDYVWETDQTSRGSQV